MELVASSSASTASTRPLGSPPVMGSQAGRVQRSGRRRRLTGLPRPLSCGTRAGAEAPLWGCEGLPFPVLSQPYRPSEVTRVIRSQEPPNQDGPRAHTGAGKSRFPVVTQLLIKSHTRRNSVFRGCTAVNLLCPHLYFTVTFGAA